MDGLCLENGNECNESNLFISFVVGPAISIEKCTFAFLPR